MEESSELLSCTMQENEGKKMRLSTSKGQKKIRYSEVSPEGRTSSQSSRDRQSSHGNHSSQGYNGKRSLGSKDKVNSPAARISHNKSNSINTNKSNNPARQRSEASDDAEFDCLTSTPMVSSQAPAPVIDLPDFSMITDGASSSKDRKYVSHSLPVSDSQFPIDLTHTQPPSPTIPSKAESVFRDSTDTLLSTDQSTMVSEQKGAGVESEKEEFSKKRANHNSNNDCRETKGKTGCSQTNSKGAENYSPSREKVGLKNDTVRAVEGKVGLHKIESEVTSPSILQPAPSMRHKQSGTWQERSTILYSNGKPRPKSGAGGSKCAMVDLTQDDAGAGSGTPCGTKRKRASSDESEVTQRTTLFKVPSRPVHRETNTADDTSASVLLLSDGEEGRLETSCQDMFADSGVEPSRDGHRSDEIQSPDAIRFEEETTTGHVIKTSTPASAASKSNKDHFFDLKDDLIEDLEPQSPSKKPKDLGYKNIEVVRRKDERAKLNGYSCRECEQYYGSLNLPQEELQKRLKQCSRHRAKYSPPPSTPPGFWNLSFPDTQEYMAKGCLKTEEDAPAQPSRYRQLKSRKRRPQQPGKKGNTRK
ncbi:uncharacterized protein LOC5504376 isoform X2 [Nematostella vectensis]|nr:uncharacterized protein LOC5504376 isoform X2 [Nematostella vectensis]